MGESAGCGRVDEIFVRGLETKDLWSVTVLTAGEQ